MLEVLVDEEGTATLAKAVQAKLTPLRELWRQLRLDAEATTSVAQLLDVILHRTDYLEYLTREKSVESIDRRANVNELLVAAALFDDQIRKEEPIDDEDVPVSPIEIPPHLVNLGRFLETVTLDGDNGIIRDGTEDAVTFMTLHSAKGLEFKVVFLVGMEQGLLPHSRALWGENPSLDELEEERRLCYVGLTRARELVFLTYATQRTLHGHTQPAKPSQFINEIPNELLERSGFASGGSQGWQRAATDWDSSPTPSASTVRALRAGNGEPPTFRPGDKVRHPSFGDGVVINASPSAGPGEWAEIAFLASGAGKKKLVIAFAPLEKL